MYDVCAVRFTLGKITLSSSWFVTNGPAFEKTDHRERNHKLFVLNKFCDYLNI